MEGRQRNMEDATHPQHLSELREEVRQLKERYVLVELLPLTLSRAFFPA